MGSGGDWNGVVAGSGGVEGQVEEEALAEAMLLLASDRRLLHRLTAPSPFSLRARQLAFITVG